MPRAALQLLAKHACQWDQCIIDDYKVIIIPCSLGHVLFRWLSYGLSIITILDIVS